MQHGPRGDVETRVGRSAPFDQVGDVGLDVFKGFSWEGAAFDGEHAAIGNGGLFGAAADQGSVQVAGAEEGMRPVAELVVEVVEGDEVVAGGQDGVGAEVGA
jgi:hypothetical protein